MSSPEQEVSALLRASSKRGGVSLRFVLLTALLTVIVATIALMSLSVLRIMRQTVERERRATAEHLAQSAASMPSNSEASAAMWLESELIVGFAIVFEDGRTERGESPIQQPSVHGLLDAGTAATVAGALDDGAKSVSRIVSTQKGHVVVAAAALDPSDRKSPRFVVALTMSSADETLATAQSLALLYMVLVGIIALVLGTLLVTRGVVRPMRRLLRATERVAEGDLQTRIAIGGVGEIAHLSEQFNTMVERVHNAREEEQQSLVALEEANRDLSATNTALQQARDDLVRAERLASVGRLAAGVAHEIGNPLASILVYLEILEEEDTEAEEAVEIIGRTRVATQRIHRIIRELLDYSRADTPSMQWMSARPAIEQAMSLVAPQPRLRGVTLVDDAKGAIPELYIDESKLVQVLINLLLNGADAVDGDGTVTLSVEEDEEHVALVVSDDGPGIPDELRARIFDPFVSSKEPGKGTGLGLAICERLVEQMQGRIAVESSSDGACFRVLFPREPPLPSERSLEAVGGEGEGSEGVD